MKEQIKALEKIQLSDEKIANLSDAELKTLVIRMLTEKTEYSHKTEGNMKAMKSEKRKMYSEPTVKGRKLDSNQQFGTKGRNKHSTRTE